MDHKAQVWTSFFLPVSQLETGSRAVARLCCREVTRRAFPSSEATRRWPVTALFFLSNANQMAAKCLSGFWLSEPPRPYVSYAGKHRLCDVHVCGRRRLPLDVPGERSHMSAFLCFLALFSPAALIGDTDTAAAFAPSGGGALCFV